MTRWFRRVIPCLRNKELPTSSLENDGKPQNTIEISNTKEHVNNGQVIEVKGECDVTERNSEVEIFTENFDQHSTVNAICLDEDGIKKHEENSANCKLCNLDGTQGIMKGTLISCSLHGSLNDLSNGKVTHMNTRCRSEVSSCSDKPCNTLVFKTIMVDGEPSTTRFKTIEPCLSKDLFSGEGDLKLSEDIKDSKIKLVFSYQVLEYLTKSFKDNCTNNVKDDSLNSDLVICTLFPKHHNTEHENEMEVDSRQMHSSVEETVNSETSDNMEVENVITNHSMTPGEYTFNSSTSPVQRSEYILTSTNSVRFQTCMSKSSPHMQQQENNCYREGPRLRRNISKKVSWKENVEVCFFNHSSRSANEILQEVQPLIDHEAYWKECECEMDRKRREKWLKIRADEQRCLTGDGQFHDYFTYRTHHFDDDEFRLIE